MASAPWQQWLLHIRKVYRWENPRETFLWLVLYTALWYTSHCVSFLLLYTILATSRNRLFPPTVSNIRDATLRAQTRSHAALRIDQLFAQLHPDELFASAKDTIGPQAQLQLNDLASLLETVNNFSEWQSPHATAVTLAMLTAAFLVTAFADVALCMRLVFFGLGVVFFGAFPIASRYPKYRLLVSPARMTFWGVPTHTEWAFEELRMEAQRNRERLIATKAEIKAELVPACEGSEIPVPTEDIATFGCRAGKTAGKLHISPSGLRLESIAGRVVWSKAFEDLVEVRKVQEVGLGRLVGGLSHGIEMVFLEGSGSDKEHRMVRLDDLGKQRDQVFRDVLGYSGLRWQWRG